MFRNHARRFPAVLVFAAASFAGDGGKTTGTNERARQLFLDTCTACHSLQRVREQRFTKEDWRSVTAGMISEGAALTDEEIALIVEYLARNFGPDNP
jgi:mono/diheme cytochrome c family protein